MNYDMDSMIDTKQLLVVTMTKWKYILITSLIGMIIGLLFTLTHWNLSNGYNEVSEDVAEQYVKDKEYYETMKSLYERWINEGVETLQADLAVSDRGDSVRTSQTKDAVEILTKIPVLKSNMDVLIEPINPGEEVPKVVSGKKVVVYIVAGCIGGAIMGFILILLYYSLTDHVLSAEEMHGRYGVRMLTVLSDESAIKQGRDQAFLSISDEEKLKMIKVGSLIPVSDDGEVLVVGTAEESILDEVTQRLNKTYSGENISFSFVKKVMSGMESYVEFIHHKNVIVVEEILSAKYEKVDREMLMLKEYEKNIVGMIGIYR